MVVSHKNSPRKLKRKKVKNIEFFSFQKILINN